MSAPRLALFAGLALSLALAGSIPGQPPRTPAPAAAAVDPHGDPLPAGARARLGTVRFRLPEYMQTAALSPDGKLLAVSNYQTIALLDTGTGREVRRLSTNYLGATALAFSPDGKVIASVDNSNRIQLREVADGKLVLQLQAQGAQKPQPPGGQPRLFSLAFSGDGKFLSAGTQSFNHLKGEVHVWELPGGKALRSVETLANNTVRSTLSADGKILATWGNYLSRGPRNDPEPAQTVQLWEVASGKELRRVRIDQAGYVTVGAAALSPDGKLLAATTSGGATLYLWDAQTGKELRRLAGRRGLGNHLIFSPDGKTIAAGGMQATVQMWDVATGKRLGTCDGPHCALMGVGFVPGGRALAWGLDGQAVALWEVPSGKSLAPLVAHQARVAALAFTAGGKDVTSIGADGNVFVWDAATGKARRQGELSDEDLRRAGQYYGPAGSGRFQSLALALDGKYACGGNYGNMVRLWETASGKAVCDFEGAQNGNMNSGVFSPDGALVALAAADGSVRIWNVASGEQVRLIKSTQKIPQGNQYALAFAPDGKTVALSGTYYERTGQATDVRAIAVGTGKELWHLKRSMTYFSAMAFSTDGKFLAVGGNLGGGFGGGQGAGPAVELLDAATGKQAYRLEGQVGQVNTMAFAPDGRTLAVGATNYMQGRPTTTIILWELASGHVRARFAGHLGMVSCLAFAPDGRTLASGGADTTVLLWDLAGDTQRAATSPPSEQELANLWGDLTGTDAQRAWEAMRKLRATPAQALPLLKKHLRPVKDSKATAEQIAQLVADLNSKRFPVRNKAQKALEDLGPPVILPLRAVLKAPGSEEQRARIEKILEKLEKVRLSPDELRTARAVETLELMATAEARELLTALAGGSPGARLTREAQGALRRLGKGA